MQQKIVIPLVLGALVVIGGTYALTTNTQGSPQRGVSDVKQFGTTQTQNTANAATSSSTNTATTSTPKPTTTTPTPKPATTPSGYTAAQVASHNSAASCWTVVNGNVYDVTSWIARHPGGQEAIKMMCGADASDAFNQQHGGQGGPERILASFKIGTFNG